MNLYEQTLKVWNDQDCASTANSWAKELHACLPKIDEFRKLFHRWNGLTVHLNKSKATKVIPTFSLRHLGQEVGEIVFHNGEPCLKVTMKQSENTRDYFGIQISPTDVPCSWKDSRQAKSFRAAFSNPGKKSPRIPEHWVEIRFIQEMKRSFRGIQPILLGGCPFQVPVPISASTGVPEAGNGHIDILSRTYGSRLRIWELKQPEEISKALSQAYIYAVTLAKMLRSEGGPAWYRLFRINDAIPENLKLDAVVAITEDQREALGKQLSEFNSPLFLKDENTKIRLYAAYYTWDPDTQALQLLEDQPELLKS